MNNLNITYLIGNGFDINLGLKTGYKSFLKNHCSYETYKKYSETKLEESPVSLHAHLIEKLNSLKGNNWVDLELEIGRFTQEYQTNSDGILQNNGGTYKVLNVNVETLTPSTITPDQNSMSIAFFDNCNIIEELAKYLKIEQDKFNVDKCNFDTFTENLKNFHNYVDDERIKNICKNKDKNISIIQFNYTDCLDKLIEKSNISIKTNIHVHGKLEYESNAELLSENLVFGLADKSQIINEKFHASDKETHEKAFANYFVKPKRIKDWPEFNQAKECISNADIIVSFGMSLGETDKNWCEYVADRLRNNKNAYFIIIDLEKASRNNFIKNTNVEHDIRSRIIFKSNKLHKLKLFNLL